LTRDEAQGWLANTLMEKVRNDRYPSATQLAIIEEVLPRAMVPDYLEVLMAKAAEDNVPSVPLLQRIMRVAQTLPNTEPSGKDGADEIGTTR
jgi:hypothetical protein